MYCTLFVHIVLHICLNSVHSLIASGRIFRPRTSETQTKEVEPAPAFAKETFFEKWHFFCMKHRIRTDLILLWKR